MGRCKSWARTTEHPECPASGASVCLLLPAPPAPTTTSQSRCALWGRGCSPAPWRRSLSWEVDHKCRTRSLSKCDPLSPSPLFFLLPKAQNKHQVKPDVFVLKRGRTDHSLATEFVFKNWAQRSRPEASRWTPADSVSPGFLKPQRATQTTGHHELSRQGRVACWSLGQIQNCLQQSKLLCEKSFQEGKPREI